MNELIARDELGVFVDKNARMRVDSLFVARAFGKVHKHVLRDIEKITAPTSGLSDEFVKLNFERSNYKDSTGRKLPCYLLTRDGFTMLVMGYTGNKAMQFKEAYIRRFNEMEAEIDNRLSQKHDFPLLTANIALIHDEPKFYHFSNECDMINRLVTGMTAKQFRESHGIPKGQSIRPYLSPEQAKMLDELQRADCYLLVKIQDFRQRKEALTEYRDTLIAYRDRRAALTAHE